MASTMINLQNKKIPVEANAYTLIIYEDRFKGRRFLKDIDSLVAQESISLATSARMLWAISKTADSSVADFCEFIKGFELSDLLKCHTFVVEILLESLSAVINPKKGKATAVIQTVLHPLRKCWRLLRDVD